MYNLYLYMDGLTFLYMGYMGYWIYMDGLTYLHMGFLVEWFCAK